MIIDPLDCYIYKLRIIRLQMRIDDNLREQERMARLHEFLTGEITMLEEKIAAIQAELEAQELLRRST